jgi:hypothetical protein
MYSTRRELGLQMVVREVAVTQSPLREERSHHSKVFKDVQSYSKGFRKKMMRHLKIQSANSGILPIRLI